MTMPSAKLNKYQQMWVNALRSNAYKQGFGALHKNGAYCVMGVCGKVLGMTDEALNIYRYTIPSEVFDRVRSKQIHSQYMLMELNDTHKMSFSEIADIIEGKEKQ